MTAQNRTTLKALFETGDTILQSSFENLIDSLLDIVEVSSQTVAGPIVFSSVVTFNDAISANGILTMNAAVKLNNSVGNIDGDIQCSGMYRTNSVTSADASIPTGTTRASALPVTKTYTVLTGVSAGTNDGIIVGSGSGTNAYSQYIINSTSATAKVYCFDNVNGSIDGTSVVQLFPNQRMIVHTTKVGGLILQYTMIGAKASG